MSNVHALPASDKPGVRRNHSIFTDPWNPPATLGSCVRTVTWVAVFLVGVAAFATAVTIWVASLS